MTIYTQPVGDNLPIKTLAARQEYCALQVSCLGRVRERHLSLSLYKLTAFVTCSITKLRATAYLLFPLDS